MRILLVEDKYVQKPVEQLLRDDGHDVVSLSGGIALVETLRGDEAFDLVIVGNKIPGLGGIHVLALIRNNLPHRKKLPFILTSSGMEGITVDDIRLYGGVFLQKPYTIAELRAKIEELQ